MTGAQTVLPSIRAVKVSDDGGGGYLVFIKGSPGWDSREPGVPAGRSRLSMNRADIELGRARFTLNYDRVAHIAEIHGVTIPLDSGNVLLVDRVDGVGGPPVVSIGGCVSLGDGRPTLWRAVATLPEVRAFLNRER